MTREDDSKSDDDFMVIGQSFQVSYYGSTIIGPIVASREALFCVLGAPARALPSSPMNMLGNAAMDLTYYLSGERSKLKGMALPCVPKRFAKNPNWPDEIPKSRPVIFVPRDQVDFISYSSVWSYRVYTNDVTLYVSLNTFGRKDCLSFLEENGWAPDRYASFISQVAPLAGIVIGAAGGWFAPVLLGGYEALSPVCAASAAVGFIVFTAIGLWTCHVGARAPLPNRDL